jgi:hypothetical protein
MDYGLLGVWASIVIANLLSGSMSSLWARSTIDGFEDGLL